MSAGEILLRRYEQLKRLYFQSSSSYHDEDDEITEVISRKQIVQMFENMGVELPLSPSDPIKFVKGRR